MNTVREISKVITVTYGDKSELLKLLRSQRIDGDARCLEKLTWRKRGNRKIEVTLIPYDKPNPADDSKKKKLELVESLKRRGLLPCTLWEVSALYPVSSFETSTEQEKFFGQIGDSYAILLLGIEGCKSWLGEEPLYLWKGRFEVHYCFQIIAPTFPVYYAGYRVVK